MIPLLRSSLNSVQQISCLNCHTETREAMGDEGIFHNILNSSVPKRKHSNKRDALESFVTVMKMTVVFSVISIKYLSLKLSDVSLHNCRMDII